MSDLTLLLTPSELLSLLSSEIKPVRDLLATGKDYTVSVESRGGMLAITCELGVRREKLCGS